MKKRTTLIISFSILFLLVSLVIHILTKNDGFNIGILNDDFFSGFFLGLGITIPALLIRNTEER